MITRGCIERIKNSVDIYDVVSPYVVLKKCGSNWRGLSPFNQEKTPSFFVMPAKRMFRCFSSGNAGDIFRFIQLQENVSFVDSVEMIATRFNIPLEFEMTSNAEQRSYTRKSLFDLHESVSGFFVKNFEDQSSFASKKLREYWTNERKFSLDVAKENGIGFAGSNDKLLVKKLLYEGFSFDAIKASGIFYYRDGETDPYHGIVRFNSRLTIPIRDIQGRVVGFSARFIDGISHKNDMSDAKYINSPETDIFHKGSLLFGLDRARQYLEPSDAFWMVEGQFDAMRCWDNGINTAIAPQGTAITDTQLGILRRYTARLNCMLDGDTAGIKAAERMLPMAMAAGLDVKFFILPGGNDPDSYFREDFEDRFSFLQKCGETGVQFLVNRLLVNKKNFTAQEKAEALTRIYEVISMSESSIARESYLDELSIAASFDRHAIAQDFKSFLVKRKFTSAPPVHLKETEETDSQKFDSAESQLLSAVLADPSIALQVSAFLDQQFLRNLVSIEGKLLIKILNEAKECMWDGISSLNNIQLFSDKEKNLAYSLSADLDDDCDLVATANLCLKKLYSDFVREEITKINEKFRKISLDENDTIRTLQECRISLREMLKTPPQIF